MIYFHRSCLALYQHRGEWIKAYHNSSDKSKQLGFDKFPEDVPFEFRWRFFGRSFQRDDVVHVGLTVGYTRKESCRDGEHCWSQDKLESHSWMFGRSGGPKGSLPSEAPPTFDCISRLL